MWQATERAAWKHACTHNLVQTVCLQASAQPMAMHDRPTCCTHCRFSDICPASLSCEHTLAETGMHAGSRRASLNIKETRGYISTPKKGMCGATPRNPSTAGMQSYPACQTSCPTSEHTYCANRHARLPHMPEFVRLPHNPMLCAVLGTTAATTAISTL